ncbi:hypothetical protein KIN20_036963 [Parelaphostrongylus tenuis]|uniref:Uncharacterized protein n=1 Tax=Parelaphostrongylus tenuis TaxID=148309 RepID=A0AAD5WLM2_PARTN|nr:hypothetical protein KIN20_036963 [Parelaphostrongylus tenuis]
MANLAETAQTVPSPTILTREALSGDVLIYEVSFQEDPTRTTTKAKTTTRTN